MKASSACPAGGCQLGAGVSGRKNVQTTSLQTRFLPWLPLCTCEAMGMSLHVWDVIYSCETGIISSTDLSGLLKGAWVVKSKWVTQCKKFPCLGLFGVPSANRQGYRAGWSPLPSLAGLTRSSFCSFCDFLTAASEWGYLGWLASLSDSSVLIGKEEGQWGSLWG